MEIYIVEVEYVILHYFQDLLDNMLLQHLKNENIRTRNNNVTKKREGRNIRKTLGRIDSSQEEQEMTTLNV